MWQERDRVRMEGGRIAWECFFFLMPCALFSVLWGGGSLPREV